MEATDSPLAPEPGVAMWQIRVYFHTLYVNTRADVSTDWYGS